MVNRTDLTKITKVPVDDGLSALLSEMNQVMEKHFEEHPELREKYGFAVIERELLNDPNIYFEHTGKVLLKADGITLYEPTERLKRLMKYELAKLRQENPKLIL